MYVHDVPIYRTAIVVARPLDLRKGTRRKKKTLITHSLTPTGALIKLFRINITRTELLRRTGADDVLRPRLRLRVITNPLNSLHY